MLYVTTLYDDGICLTYGGQATTKLRAFFLAHLAPIRKSMTTNMHVLHGAVLTKYHPLYVFLQRQSPAVATEIQRAYVAAARTYYETGFRRYIRSLNWIKVRHLDDPLHM